METNPIIILDSFNNYFGSIAEITKNEIPKTETVFSSFLGDNVESSFFMSPTTENEISAIIRLFDHKKAVGPCSIPTQVLKIISPIISTHLSDIINISLNKGIFPSCLKSSYVVPIHKKDSKVLVENYRPISLLSNIGKIFEKIMHTRMTSFLTKNKTLFNNQFGFRNKHSTIHALIKLSENISSALDSGKIATGVFIDLKKAFDTVDHSILLKKLEHYGFRGLSNNWFKTYLTERTQKVLINGIKSNQISIKHGVPQGSVLGPLLFLIYINDLHNAIIHSTVYHFADDTSILNINNSIKKINMHVNHDLKHLCIWLRANKISLNATKTTLINFRSTSKKNYKKN